MKNDIVIIDYGLGNLMSLLYKFNKIGINATVSSDKKVIADAGKLILPGVGHFAKGMENIRKYDLIPVLNKRVLDEKTPILGICLGMQLLTRNSEEGQIEGLGWIDAETKRFDLNGLKIPHMGWNTIEIKKKGHIFDGIEDNSRFYFVHSYHVCCKDKDVLATTNYGHDFASVIRKDNIYGVQFHPEKSHKAGMKIIKNFAGVV